MAAAPTVAAAPLIATVPLTDSSLLAVGPMPDDVLDMHQQTVPRRFVHRGDISGVLLTGFRNDGGDRFTFGVQWPRSHGFYGPVNGRHDPMMVAETVRQAGLALGHLGYGVPEGHVFMMQNLRYRMTAHGLSLTGTPSDVLARVVCKNVRRRGTQLVSLTFDIWFEREGSVVGSGSGSFRCVAPQVYTKLRASQERPPTPGIPGSHPLPPASVGRLSRGDVVVAATEQEGRWLIRADPRHPVLFDHPADHIPGMLLMEAARQVMVLVSGPGAAAPLALRGTFEHYVELDEPAYLRLVADQRGGGDAGARFLIEQRGSVCAEITLNAPTDPS
ncbi:ScbA/BarX family gamma-butyrolactone biosynthesis protein [Streptomyces sp. NBC_01190]|uniref:ScbA/BarX family gamma-butyrolactone biosynthesis protein n=1 Tax=Streptomyces sp. NBC_01190 TaxID=2903767 RepID=UPI003865E81E|nr:gamma-butyrolactone biosynthesis protein [Streptomyces sp. NBC_01190]